MSTQWIWDQGQRVGMNYAALGEVWRRLKVPAADRDGVFCDLRIMEHAALDELRQQREARGSNG